MEREIDLAPRHLVAWLKDEAAGGALAIQATREFLAEDTPASGDGLDAEDGIAVQTTVGLIEVSPRAGACRWTLRLRIEDPVGCHLPDDGSVPDGPEEIGLEDFEACFLTGDDPDGTVTIEADDHDAARAFDRLLARMLADSHRRGS